MEARKIEAQFAATWTGDLDDDCSARWAGFLLRAEEMEDGVWWYAVHDVALGLTIEDSTVLGADVHDSSTARQKCENAARRSLGLPANAKKA